MGPYTTDDSYIRVYIKVPLFRESIVCVCACYTAKGQELHSWSVSLTLKFRGVNVGTGASVLRVGRQLVHSEEMKSHEFLSHYN